MSGQQRKAVGRGRLAAAALFWLLLPVLPAGAAMPGIPAQVLAFYYGWYGNPEISGRWVHWRGVDQAAHRIANAVDGPRLGAYDSHDPRVVERQAAEARAAGLTGFIASWFGRRSFEDDGLPLLLAAARRQGLSVSVLYEKIAGAEPAARLANVVADLDYLLSRYAGDQAWLRVDGRPVLFVYGRALRELSPAEWRQAIAAVRHDNPAGVLLVATADDPAVAAVFDGVGRYNFAQAAQAKAPPELAGWAHDFFGRLVAAAAPGKIATVTVIPGCDDSSSGRPPPRPIVERQNGETYRTLWREAIAAAPDWVLITSWNEWHEATEIEPSLRYGDGALADTAAMSRRFLARRAPRETRP